MKKKLLRLLRVVPLALLFASVASAQTTGTIIGVVTDASTGQPVAGAVVIATSPALQGQQTAVTDNAGNYRLQLLPPGAYTLTVQYGGYKDATRSDISLRLDKTIRANMAVIPEAVQMEEQVVRTGVAPVVNVGSAESGSVVTREFIANMPVARGYEAIAVTAPTARLDQYGISFAGAQSPENQYIVDGMNTTDPVFGTRAGASTNPIPALRSDFTNEIDVKTGNFSPEYGRATGGIVNVVLKSGSNEYHGSIFSNFTPSFWVQPNGKSVGGAGQAIGVRVKPDNGSYDLDFGAEVGGPIIRDRLWFYAGFSPVVGVTGYERFLRSNVVPDAAAGETCPAGYTPDGDVRGFGGQCIDEAGNFLQNTIPGTQQSYKTIRTTYQMVGKLTYLLNENHSFTLSGWGAPSSRRGLGGNWQGGGSPLYTGTSNRYTYTDDSQMSVLARYTGKYLDKKLITEVQAGWYQFDQTPKNRTTNGVDQFATPALEWLQGINISDFESVPGGACGSTAECPVYGYTVGGRTGIVQTTKTSRLNTRASAGYLFDLLGQHTAKVGIDLERVDYKDDRAYAGGFYYLYSGGLFTAFRGFGTIDADQIAVDRNHQLGTELSHVSSVHPTVGKNHSRTDSFSYYVQDGWQLGFLPNVTLNYGVRLETQSMTNLDFKDATGFSINNNWSPRVQAIWDFTGNGRGKVAASWGRFYYAMPLDMGSRAFGGEVSLRYNLSAASCGFVPGQYGTFNPGALGFPGQGFSTSTSCSLLRRGSASADDNVNDIRLTGGTLTPADSNLQGAFVDQFGAQVEYEVLADLSLGLEYQARRQGNVIEDMSSDDGSTYYIGNPGANRDITLPDGQRAGNSRYVSTTDPTTGRPVDIQFPKPERSYDGFTLKLSKLFSKNWMLSGSYTLSWLRGNYPGPYRPEDGQLDPGITSEYDLASLMANKKGYLPGDQRHSFKLYGAYAWNFGPSITLTTSAAYTGTAGNPVNALGKHVDYGNSQAFIIPRGQGGTTPWVNTIDMGANLAYVIKAPYAVKFGVNVFNVFNAQTATAYDEDYTFDVVTPISSMNCSSRNSVGKGTRALQADCAGLGYLKTVDGRPVTVNPNWGKPAPTTGAFQAPLSLRLSLSLQF